MCVAVLGAPLVLCADLASVKKETRPEKRAELAMDHAEASLKSAQDAYLVKGDLKGTASALNELAASVELAYDSLVETRKNPSKSPKHFKRAEIRTREILRRLDDFREQMSVEDREATVPVRAAIQKVHEQLLGGIMSGKKH